MNEVAAGVDLGGTKIQAVVVSDGKVVGRARRATPRTGPDAVVEQLAASVREALDDGGVCLSELAAVGVGSPGSVTRETGSVSKAPNVFGSPDEVPLGPAISAALEGVAVAVDNDVRVAVMGEFRRGAGRPYRDLLGVFVGSGVGGGLVMHGELRHGRGNAGEIGHTTVKPDGRRCSCQRDGCLEAYAGRMSIESTARSRQNKGHKTKLFDIMERKGRDRVTSSVIADALDQGDRITTELIDEAVEALGIALANAQNLLDLQAIIVGGGLADRLGEPFVRRVEVAMVKNLRLPDQPPAVLPTELGDLSGAVGATVMLEY
ncbi:MAG TPA: ROK family protein [Acidimicrobiales bacterium]|nr:ROK family protein [Acidimicrobiales bacterium]